MKRLSAVLLHPRTPVVLYALAALAASLHLYLLGTHDGGNGHHYTSYNNYVIFRQSFFHLLDEKDLYAWHLAEQWDLYKYSPAFALAFGALAWMPDWLGLILWNGLNAFVLLAAIRKLPLDENRQTAVLLFVFVELLTSLQNAQSNGLLAGLLIAAFNAFEKKKLAWAALAIVGATFIKVYGAVGFALFLFYPGKWRFIALSALWTALLAALPLAVLSPNVLMDQYQSWARMMAEDHAASYGISVMGWLHAWFGVGKSAEKAVLLAGLVLFALPLLRPKAFASLHFRLLFLAQLLLWIIVFNHKAESPTYVIAVAGVALWYWSSEKKAAWRKVLLWAVFVLTCLSPTDLFPPVVKREIFEPLVVKAVPCILVWAVVVVELMRIRFREDTHWGNRPRSAMPTP